MNKTTKYALKKLENEHAFLTSFGIHKEKEVWDQICEKISFDNNYAYKTAAMSLIKYVLRQHYVLGKKKESLSKIRNKKDNLKIVTVRVFSGRFSYDKKMGGYVNWFRRKKVSYVLKDYYEAKYDRDITKAWSRIKKSICLDSGNEASLIHKFEEPHVYFIKSKTTNNIKIGVSKNPNERKKQIKQIKGDTLEILKIIASGGYALESKLHRKFSKYRVNGEWFRPSKELLSYIDSIEP